jgi:3alpha(or 20beta)-hydroxysteroid dehydrogenase
MTGVLGDRLVVITGAARGLGAAIAESCVSHGGRVVVTDVLEEPLAETARRLGPSAMAHPLDVADPASWDRLAEWMRSGPGSPHGLVNNAGIVRPASFRDTTLDQLRSQFDINVAGTFLGMQWFARLHDDLAESRSASIVNISSVRGLISGMRSTAYSATKFAVRGLTKAAAVELGAAGIRVNAVCPGPIESDMSIGNPDFAQMDWTGYAAKLPLGRMGRPPEIGETVAWLLSDASAFITGTDIPVDGGLTATGYSVEPYRR